MDSPTENRLEPSFQSDSAMELDELAPLNPSGSEQADTISNSQGWATEQLVQPSSGRPWPQASIPRRKTSLNRFWTTIVSLVVVLSSVGLLLARYRHSHAVGEASRPKLRSNGTSNFAPTTLLISLDGFRADFLLRGLTPTLSSFVSGGISPTWMLPSFPSVTFSNHYTLATGLYPESHGIVSNTFWDPGLKEQFTYANDSVSMVPKWWGGEPIWVTTERQDVRTAVHMWPGSEARIGGIQPTFLDKFNGDEDLAKKTERILGLLDLPEDDYSLGRAADRRPQFIAAYVPVIDAEGHRYGPNSTEVNTTLRKVDAMFSNLLQGLQQRNLTDIINVVVVSDHGMATTSTQRLIQLDDLLDVDLIEHIDGWPNYGLRLKDPSIVEEVYHGLREKAAMNSNFEVYLRDKNMPERYHFSQNLRIAPLWLLPRTGWAIVLRKDFDVAAAKASGQIYHPRGVHGYDHEHALMRAIFIARGPAFPHRANSRLDVFQNTEVYNIICDSLSVTPKPNNGTLRLPLRPTGLHSDPTAPELEAPDDPL